MRRKNVRFLVMILTILVATGLHAQEGPPTGDAAPSQEPRQDVFAPFVSRLRVAVRDPQVRLTWRDSEDLEAGEYQIYRHRREITADTFGDATLIDSVDRGVETYLDTPLETGEYFYAVVAAEADGTVYPIFVPFRNKTIRAINVTRLETEEDLAARVYDLVAQAQDNVIALRFNTSRGGRRLAVYRSTRPFDQLESPAEATLLERLDSSTRRFVDYPVPGVAYFYGIFDTALVERGSIEIAPGSNVLATPVQIPLRVARDVQLNIPSRTTRPAPLPILELTGTLRDDQRLVAGEVPYGGRAQPVRAATTRAIDRLLRDAPQPQPFDPAPVVLPPERTNDAEDSANGAGRTLTQVIQNYFVAGDYASTANLLRNLLELPLSRDFERRVRYYLAQSLYFDGRREPAFVEFLIAADGNGALYSEVRPWIEGILQAR